MQNRIIIIIICISAIVLSISLVFINKYKVKADRLALKLEACEQQAIITYNANQHIIDSLYTKIYTSEAELNSIIKNNKNRNEELKKQFRKRLKSEQNTADSFNLLDNDPDINRAFTVMRSVRFDTDELESINSRFDDLFKGD